MTPKTLGAFEAKTHFSALIQAAERGETIVVTRNGKPVAQIGPIIGDKPSLTAREAMNGLLSIGARLRGVKLRDLVDEGRRF